MSKAEMHDWYCFVLDGMLRGLKCNFKVVGTVKIHWPLQKSEPLSVRQRAPYISSQAVILTKFRFASCVPMDETVFPAWNVRSTKKVSLRPGNARLQKWRAWELHCHAFPVPTRSLSDNCVSCTTLNNFKSHIRLHWDWKSRTVLCNHNL